MRRFLILLLMFFVCAVCVPVFSVNTYAGGGNKSSKVKQGKRFKKTQHRAEKRGKSQKRDHQREDRRNNRQAVQSVNPRYQERYERMSRVKVRNYDPVAQRNDRIARQSDEHRRYQRRDYRQRDRRPYIRVEKRKYVYRDLRNEVYRRAQIAAYQQAERQAYLRYARQANRRAERRLARRYYEQQVVRRNPVRYVRTNRSNGYVPNDRYRAEKRYYNFDDDKYDSYDDYDPGYQYNYGTVNNFPDHIATYQNVSAPLFSGYVQEYPGDADISPSFFDYGDPLYGGLYYDDPYRPSFYRRHRNVLNIGIGAGTGALLGGIFGGKRGALIGAGVGAGAGAAYTYGINPKN